MNRLSPVSLISDIPDHLMGTPPGLLLEYHNLGRPHETYDSARLLIGMCMDNRKHLRMPDNFAFIIRTGGANLRFSEFKVSYAIAVGKVNHIALIGHSQCGMVNLHARKDLFINGLVQSGWDPSFAEEHFNHYSPLFEIGNEIDFLLTESVRLRNRYPKITVCPMYYRVEDNLLYLVKEQT